HFLAVTVEGGVRVDLDLHLARQTLFGQTLEHQRALALRGVFRHHVRELDGDRIGRMGQAGDAEGQRASESLGSKLEHVSASSLLCVSLWRQPQIGHCDTHALVCLERLWHGYLSELGAEMAGSRLAIGMQCLALM